jgi:hypothetical protein
MCLWVAILFSQSVVRAQTNYTIDWATISGGGASSSGGIYSVSGTIGQHDAGGPMTGITYSLTGGFWSLFAVQTPGAPLLTIRLTSTNTVAVSWPSSSAGWNLQQHTNLATTNWIAVGPIPSDDGTSKTVIVNPPAGNRFFRLFRSE